MRDTSFGNSGQILNCSGNQDKQKPNVLKIRLIFQVYCSEISKKTWQSMRSIFLKFRTFVKSYSKIKIINQILLVSVSLFWYNKIKKEERVYEKLCKES